MTNMTKHQTILRGEILYTKQFKGKKWTLRVPEWGLIFEISMQQIAILKDRYGEEWPGYLEACVLQERPTDLNYQTGFTNKCVYLIGNRSQVVRNGLYQTDELTSNMVEALRAARICWIHIKPMDAEKSADCAIAIVDHDKYYKSMMQVVDDQKLLEQAYDLPPLTGTPAQIEWASNIRGKLLPQVNDYIIKLQDKGFHKLIHNGLRTTSASWWIDNRMLSASAMAKKIARDGINVILDRAFPER